MTLLDFVKNFDKELASDECVCIRVNDLDMAEMSNNMFINIDGKIKMTKETLINAVYASEYGHATYLNNSWEEGPNVDRATHTISCCIGGGIA